MGECARSHRSDAHEHHHVIDESGWPFQLRPAGRSVCTVWAVSIALCWLISLRATGSLKLRLTRVRAIGLHELSPGDWTTQPPIVGLS